MRGRKWRGRWVTKEFLPPLSLYPPAGGPCAWVAVAVVGVVAGAVVVAEGYCTVSTREANRLVCGVLMKRRA